jgi:hypothetical protein
MTNIVFCQPETLVYELHPSLRLNGCFFRVCQLFRLLYHADAFSAVAGVTKGKMRWTVDIRRVINRVEALLRELG